MGFEFHHWQKLKKQVGRTSLISLPSNHQLRFKLFKGQETVMGQYFSKGKSRERQVKTSKVVFARIVGSAPQNAQTLTPRQMLNLGFV